MTQLETHQYHFMSDNYGVLVHSPQTDETAAIDAGNAETTLKALEEKGWKLTHIFVTHHHFDHVEGLGELKAKTNCHVIGPKDSQSPISGIDQYVEDGDTFQFGGRAVEVIHTPGHTLDMINYHFSDQKIIFTGDTLFALGCGRLFEGTPEIMWESMKKLMKLPVDTQIYCGHEYTSANADFAVTVDPENTKLLERVTEIKNLREQGKPTIPTILSRELETNPFLRAGDPRIREHLGMVSATDAEVFTEIRKRKDNF